MIQPALFRGPAISWLLRRQRGVCAGCPTALARKIAPTAENHLKRPYWRLTQAAEIDHTVPLWRVALMEPPRNRWIRWWLPGNLQLVCVPCHRDKTAREAAERAAMRSPQTSLLEWCS